MATKLNTRILLRYDSYENWVKDTATVLLEGEVAICTVPAGYTKSDSGVQVQNPPKTLMKVGPGAFKDLPWLSAVAADVYEWAKKSEVDFRAWLTSAEGPSLATKTEVNNVASDLAALAGRVTTAEGDIDALEGRMGTAEDDIDALEGRMDAAEEDIADLQAAVGTGADGLATKVEGLTTRMGEAESNISANSTAIENITKEGGAIDAAVAAEAEIARAAEKANADAIDAIEADYLKAADKTELSNAINAEKQRAESAEAGLDTKINSVSEVANAADTLSKSNKTAIDTLNGNADTVGSVRQIAADEINTLIGGVSSADTIDDIKTLIEYVNENGADFTELNGTVAGHTASISTITGQISELQGKDVELVEDIGEINNKIGTATLDTTAKTLIEAVNEVNAAVTAGDEATLAAANKHADDAIAALSTGNGVIAGLESRVAANENKLTGISTTVVATIEAAQTAAEQKVTDLANGQVKTNTDAIAAINNADTGILAQAEDYTDAEIATVNSAIQAEATARANFDKTALTGVITDDVLAVSLNGTALDLIFQCGGATLA